MKKIRQIIKNLSIRTKLLLSFAFTSVILLTSNLLLYGEVNETIQKIDGIYASNVSLNDLSEALGNMQDDIYEYLKTRSSDALEDYYRNNQDYQALIGGLNADTTDNEMKLLEKNIRNMSATYLKAVDATVQAKRASNTQKYKDSYQETQKLYQYINDYIYSLNNMQFKANSNSYQVLLGSLNFMEVVSTVILVLVCIFNTFLLFLITRSIIRPLSSLAKTANEVAAGNLDAPLLEVSGDDEVGIVTKAFNLMVFSIKEYIEKITLSMEKEQKMMERELLMETHLKDAQLKYLQAQINPHFLFNSLNAGAQLAMMEDAEKTCLFIERMADFFRYNVRKMTEVATLEEEIETVDNYIYILNVRFAGDIHFTKEVDTSFHDVKIPSMILQPIVENAVNYGIRNIEWEGMIRMIVERAEDGIRIRIMDNGRGMEPERIREVMEKKAAGSSMETDSTGIGLDNVINRLELYYNTKGILSIHSEGIDQGTEITLNIPLKQCRGMEEEEEQDV